MSFSSNTDVKCPKIKAFRMYASPNISQLNDPYTLYNSNSRFHIIWVIERQSLCSHKSWMLFELRSIFACLAHMKVLFIAKQMLFAECWYFALWKSYRNLKVRHWINSPLKYIGGTWHIWYFWTMFFCFFDHRCYNIFLDAEQLCVLMKLAMEMRWSYLEEYRNFTN